MYKIPDFTETQQEEVFQFMYEHSFIMLAGCADGRVAATQVPVLVRKENGKIIIAGHIMRSTDHHKAFEKNPQVLALFNGPHCYVSASWYTERRTASTWNYITVHARGHIRFFTDEETIDLLTQLTNKYEHGRSAPELVETMPQKYIKANVKAIAGFEIEVDDLHPIFKLSQNRDDESYKKIVTELQATRDGNDKEVANEMIKRRPHLF